MAQASQELLDAGPLSVEESEEVVGRSPWQLFWLRFRQDRAAMAGGVFLAILLVLGLGAPLIATVVGHGPNERFTREMTDEFGIPRGPTGDFLFGADLAGRDLFVRVVYGIQTSLRIALGATGLAVLIGVSLGLIAGYRGGWLDTLISRSADIILSLPVLLFALGLAAACGSTAVGCLNGLIKPGLGLITIIIALFTWPYMARIVRGNTLSIKEKEFIEASRSVGASNTRIMFRDILPNLVAPIIVYSTLIIPSNIIFEASLSFLGVGIPQQFPSWGRMLSEASGDIVEVAPWMMIFPGLFLFFTTLAFNLVGDGLRDALDPRSGR